MQRPATLAAAVAFAVVSLVGAPAVAAPLHRDASAAPATEVSAQSRRRPPASITVRPQRRAYPYRHTNSLYPPAYETEYPGPNGVRRCAGQYTLEARASGTVIMPRLHCRWVRG